MCERTDLIGGDLNGDSDNDDGGVEVASGDELEFEDWDNFVNLLTFETPFDLQQFIIDEGDRLTWYDQGMFEAFESDKELSNVDDFIIILRNFISKALKELNEEFEYALKEDYESKIELLINDAKDRHKRYWNERSNKKLKNLA